MLTAYGKVKVTKLLSEKVFKTQRGEMISKEYEGFYIGKSSKNNRFVGCRIRIYGTPNDSGWNHFPNWIYGQFEVVGVFQNTIILQTQMRYITVTTDMIGSSRYNGNNGNNVSNYNSQYSIANKQNNTQQVNNNDENYTNYNEDNEQTEEPEWFDYGLEEQNAEPVDEADVEDGDITDEMLKKQWQNITL